MTSVASTTEEQVLAARIERAWTSDEFEALPEDEAAAVLLGRMRKLTLLGLDPMDALMMAAQLRVPLS